MALITDTYTKFMAKKQKTVVTNNYYFLSITIWNKNTLSINWK